MVVVEVGLEVEEVLVVDVVLIHLGVVIVADTGADVAEDTLRTRSGEQLSTAYTICLLEYVR